jgi:glutamine amidotransferase
MGWDEVWFERSNALFDGVPDGSDFYFVHSYVLWPDTPRDVLARTAFGAERVVTAIQRDNVLGVQFHPEKSQRLGFQIIRNFLSC